MHYFKRVRAQAPLALAVLALFFALGGPSFAADAAGSAVKLITGKNVKNNSLTTQDVRNGSLLAADFKPGQLPAGAQGAKGDPGPKGDTGPAGANGANGTDGDDGTSVTSATEPPGPNCPDGGVRFTSASGDSYACDGAKGDTGPPGTTGQNATTLFGSGALTVTPTTAETDVPGLSTTINVPAGGSRIYVATDGGLNTTSTAATGHSTVDIAVSVDGTIPQNGLYARVTCANTTGVTTMSCRWGTSSVIGLGPGSHTIKVKAFGVSSSAANASVSGAVGTVNQGSLSVIVLKV